MAHNLYEVINLEYIIGLKKEMGLLNEKTAKERYLELRAMGYSDHDIILAAPVPVQVHLHIGQPNVANTEGASTTGMNSDVAGETGYSDVSGINHEEYELPSDTLS